MKESLPTRRLEPPTLEQFRVFVRKIVSVPKTDIKTEESEYRKRRKAKKRKLTSHVE